MNPSSSWRWWLALPLYALSVPFWVAYAALQWLGALVEGVAPELKD